MRIRGIGCVFVLGVWCACAGPGAQRASSRTSEPVLALVQKAEAALSAGFYAEALKHALDARAMPVDLDDVQTVASVNGTLDKVTREVESKIEVLKKQNHWDLAVQLCDQIAAASPGVPSRQVLAEQVRTQAQAYYVQQAEHHHTQKAYGSEALQWALAKRVGASVKAEQIQTAWQKFSDTVCPGVPEVHMHAAKVKRTDVVEDLAQVVKQSVSGLELRCGKGKRSFQVHVTLSDASVKDVTQKERKIQPLPGVRIATEEVYYEEQPYTEVEESVVMETRTEKQERRDCAPRPGKPRGCSTWYEDVQVQVPVKQRKEVQKIRKIEKRRAVSGPLPKDKVVEYEVVHTSRSVSLVGQVLVAGVEMQPRPFAVLKQSEDEGHDAVYDRGVSVPANSMDVLPLESLREEALRDVAKEAFEAAEAAVKTIQRELVSTATAKAAVGEIQQAEEWYLKGLALERVDRPERNPEWGAFFDKHYGRKVADVMAVLSSEMRDNAGVEQKNVRMGRGWAFPSRQGSSQEQAKEDATPLLAPSTLLENPGTSQPAAKTAKNASEGSLGLTEDELRELEDASLKEPVQAAKKEEQSQ